MTWHEFEDSFSLKIRILMFKSFLNSILHRLEIIFLHSVSSWNEVPNESRKEPDLNQGGCSIMFQSNDYKSSWIRGAVYYYLYVKKIYKKEAWAFLERKPLSSNCFLDDIAVQNDLNVKRIFIVRKIRAKGQVAIFWKTILKNSHQLLF